VIELLYLGGLPVNEIGEPLVVSTKSITRDLAFSEPLAYQQIDKVHGRNN
jgi:hypothetical protein